MSKSGVVEMRKLKALLEFLSLKLTGTLFLLLLVLMGRSQSDSLRTYNIGLLLPFQTTATIDRLNGFLNAADFFTASRIKVDENALIALDFYQGVLQSLNESQDSNLHFNIYAYDTWDSDSITQEILKKPELKKLDLIIGSVSSSEAKLIAEFCKKNKILNLQPFTPSKSLTSDNPYHIKLAPTIDSHIDNMFLSITETYPGANIIIYSPNNDNGSNAAKRFDSLFTDYNKTAGLKFPKALLSTKDMMVDGKKTTAGELLQTGKKNILIITSFEESFANSSFRTLHDKLEKNDIITYGMPTWLKGEVMRLDYVNDFHSRLTDAFWVDTAKGKDIEFTTAYKTNYNVEPSRYSFLGYDLMNFTIRVLGTYGTDFPEKVATQRYTGLAYKFDIMRQMKGENVSYYENTHVNVMQVEDYQLKKVW